MRVDNFAGRLTFRHATPLVISMTTYYSRTPLPYTLKPRHEWNRRDFFDYEVDSYCRCATRVRYRSREWHEFTLYLILPEGEYTPEEYPEGWHFRRGH